MSDGLRVSDIKLLSMGSATSKYCSESCASEKFKSGEQNSKHRNLLVSNEKKRGVKKVNEHRWKPVASTDRDTCLNKGLASAFPCGCSWGTPSVRQDYREPNDVKSDGTGEFSHGAALPGWSGEEFGRLKDAIEYACHVQHVNYPSYSASQV